MGGITDVCCVSDGVLLFDCQFYFDPVLSVGNIISAQLQWSLTFFSDPDADTERLSARLQCRISVLTEKSKNFFLD